MVSINEIRYFFCYSKRKGRIVVMKKILYHIFLLLCIAVFCISAYKLYGYYKSYKEAKDTYEKIKKDNVKKTNGDRTIVINFGQRIQTLLAGFTQRGQELIIRSFKVKITKNIFIWITIRKKAVQGRSF